ncbi:MAG: hypothetical protein OXG25_15535 [Gammaproteobacteria bacterium]|nr:hypothetical protein [Gammaproteobacteria bacterium]
MTPKATAPRWGLLLVYFFATFMSVSAETTLGPDPCTIDSDGDNVMDCHDHCPGTPGEIINNGCPDTSHDGYCGSEAEFILWLYGFLGITMGIAAFFTGGLTLAVAGLTIGMVAHYFSLICLQE